MFARSKITIEMIGLRSGYFLEAENGNAVNV
jgi:hypothetical protein